MNVKKKMKKNDNKRQKIKNYMDYFCTNFSLGISNTTNIEIYKVLKS